MVPRVHVVGIPLDASREEIVDLLVSSPHTRYPVYREDLDDVVGVLHVKDVLRLLTQDAEPEGHPLRSVPYVPETARVDVVLAAMRRERTQLAIILDEHGGTAGLVSIEDLFEEVVGEIEEEAERPHSWTDDHGGLHVAGTVRIEEVGEHFGTDLEHEDVDTVSGLVLTLLDRPPEVGDTVSYDGVVFEVLATEGHGAAECLVTPRRPEEQEDGSAG
jgi:CBS domain containing-hemolysin-like protein